MIITKEILNQKAPGDKIPTRLDSALNLYTNINYNNQSGLILYNTNPETWNCLYPFYELNHKFTIDNYTFKKKSMTYKDLIDEYNEVYKNEYEIKKGYSKEKRKEILATEFKNTFTLNSVNISEELEPIYELKYSKSKNVWTLYYFENYVANEVDSVEDLLNQKLYEQKIVPLDYKDNEVDGIELVSNLSYLLSIKRNLEKLRQNKIKKPKIMNRNFVESWLKNLKEYWLNKDIESAVALFKKTTFYQETPFMKPYTTLEEIAKEWEHVENENIQNIEINILAIDGNIVIAHWTLKQNNLNYDGIYEIKFNQNLECIYFKSWEMNDNI